MRLFGVTMVRNEADIIEVFVRHNLGVLDGLVVVDHDSIDGTAEILAKLQAEGLPLRVARDADPAYRQSETMTALAREALTGDAADFVFALDADEFLKVESRADLEATLAEVPGSMHAAMHWLTYVPDAFDDDAGGFGPGHLWWRLKTERRKVMKVVASHALLERQSDFIATGNHAVLSRPLSKALPQALLRREAVALGHCPVRSRTQLEGKIIVGHLARSLANLPSPYKNDLYKELRAGGTFDGERLRQIACNFMLPREQWQRVEEIELVEDPVRLTAEQRYRVDAVCDPLQVLLRFTETLVAAEREQGSGAGVTRHVML